MFSLPHLDMDKQIAAYQYDVSFETNKWAKLMPELELPAGHSIKIIPDGTAVVKFQVINTKNQKWASVYLDCYDLLGCVGSPYWEVYAPGEDCERFAMADTAGLIATITKFCSSDAGDHT